jgi:hypothetical protein
VADQNNPSIHVVMPVHGRMMQTVDCMKRLKAMAGYPASYTAIGGLHNDATLMLLDGICTVMRSQSASLTYWYALHMATAHLPDDAYVVNVANDVLPCAHWLTRYAEHIKRFPHHVFGFNGDGYEQNHACHFGIQMKRIRNTGGWPTWYYHNYGDTEICTRAIEDGAFHKDPWAILFHNHPIISGQEMDEVYVKGSEHQSRDADLYLKRRASQWTYSLTS